MKNILAKPVKQAFIVAPDKAEAFLSQKGDKKMKERIMKLSEKARSQCVRDERYKGI